MDEVSDLHNFAKCAKLISYIITHFQFILIFAVFCSPLSTIDNGNITYTTNLTEEGYIVDKLAELHCDPGYESSVSSTESRRCERSGDWNGQTQTCIGGNGDRIFSFR